MNSHCQLAEEFPSSAGAVQARLQSVLVVLFMCARMDTSIEVYDREVKVLIIYFME